MRKTICLCISILLVLFAGVSCTQYQYWPIPMPSVEKYTITLVVGNGETEEHSVKEGSSYVLPDDFTMDGKTLVGWKDADGVIHDIGEEITPVSDMVFFGDWLTGGMEAKVDGVEYESPYEAMKSIVDEAKDGSRIEIYSDSTGGGIGIMNGNDPADFPNGLTVDFNGHDYIFSTAPVGSPGYETQGFHFEKDNTVILQNGVIKNDKGGTKFMIQNYADLTLDNIELVPDSEVQELLSINCGTVILKNGTKLNKLTNSDGYNADLYYWPSSYPEGCTLIIETSDVVLDAPIAIGCQSGQAEDAVDKINMYIPNGYPEPELVAGSNMNGATFEFVPSDDMQGYQELVISLAE